VRFYSKLLAIILLTAAMQHYLLAGENLRLIWFGVRCDIAYAMHDKVMIETLICEAGELRDTDVFTNASGG